MNCWASGVSGPKCPKQVQCPFCSTGTKSWKLQKCLCNASSSVPFLRTLKHLDLPISDSGHFLYSAFNRKVFFALIFCRIWQKWTHRRLCQETDKISFFNEHRNASYVWSYFESNPPMQLSSQSTCWGRTGCLSNPSPVVETSEKLSNFIFLKHHCAIVLKYLTHKIDIHYQTLHSHFELFSCHGL